MFYCGAHISAFQNYPVLYKKPRNPAGMTQAGHVWNLERFLFLNKFISDLCNKQFFLHTM